MYGLRRPSSQATVRAPGDVISARTLRSSRPSTLLSATAKVARRPRSVRSRAASGFSPQAGQNGVAHAAPQLGHVQASGAELAVIASATLSSPACTPDAG